MQTMEHDWAFASATIGQRLDQADAQELDGLPFGVIALDEAGCAVAYSRLETEYSGLPPDRVLGRPFFSTVAPCMDNELVGERIEQEPELDATLDYVLTYRMRACKVRLRLLRSAHLRRRYVLVDRRPIQPASA